MGAERHDASDASVSRAVPGTPASDARAPREPGAIDWAALREAAIAVLPNAYVPYSGFRVGAAALTDSGVIIAGCNVENASYGITLCAECAIVSALHTEHGGGRLVAFTCVDGDGHALMPCGRCRQLLLEHSAPGMLCETVSGIRSIDEVLPDAFGPRTLEAFGRRVEG